MDDVPLIHPPLDCSSSHARLASVEVLDEVSSAHWDLFGFYLPIDEGLLSCDMRRSRMSRLESKMTGTSLPAKLRAHFAY